VFSSLDNSSWRLCEARLRRKRIWGDVIECGEDFVSEESEGQGASRSAAAWSWRLANPGMRWRAWARHAGRLQLESLAAHPDPQVGPSGSPVRLGRGDGWHAGQVPHDTACPSLDAHPGR
jgi:hypothetical protein